VLVLRLHDPRRRPVNWTGIIRPGQFAAIAKDLATSLPCDAEGRPFDDPAAATCVVFDRFDEARAFCEAAVATHESVQFEVFDAQGRSKSPLVTVMHPSRTLRQDAHPRVVHKRRIIAWALIAGGVPLLFLSYRLYEAGHAIFPGFIGLNLIFAGGRLLWYNMALSETERARQNRIDSL
jgi:hypothetical protein